MSGTNTSGRKGKVRKEDTAPQGMFTAECPKWMTKDGREYWDKIVPMLIERNVITDLDAFAVERLCQLHSDWSQCVEVLNKDGIFYDHQQDRGSVNVAVHPAVRMKRDCEAEINRLSAKFGLTPKDREAIKAHKGKTSGSIRSQY